MGKKYFEGFDGDLRGFIVHKVTDKVNNYFVEFNQIKVIVCGLPMIDSKILNAKNIFNLYLEYGLNGMVKKVDGNYSLIIIDEKKSSISILRDRIGLSPAYYSFNNGFTCCSNVGPIVKSGLKKYSHNKKVIGRYASCNFRANYGSEETFFNDIFQIPPANLLTFKNKKILIKRYWDLDPKKDYFKLEGQELLNYYNDQIKTSVKNYFSAFYNKKSLVSLSGGVDSGTIIGMLHEITGKRVDAISLSYDEKTEYDESNLIRYSVRDHARNWFDIKLDPMKMLSDMETYYNRFDVPLATVSIYGYDYLYRKIAEMGYENIYSGAGGDYLQAGNYPCFLYYFADLKFSNSPFYEKEVGQWINNHGTKKFPKSFETVENFFKKNIDFSESGKLKKQELFLMSENILDEDFYDNIGDVKSNIVYSYGTYLRSYFVQELFFEAVPPGIDAENIIDWTYGTRMISPFFSKNLIELGWELPPSKKIKNGINKVLSRKSLQGICASEILQRKQKNGFNAPFDIYLRSQLKDFALDIFQSKSFNQRGIYNIKKFKNVLSDHFRGRKNHMMLLWQALNLELWMCSWVDN
ncbi:MAG: asparagine synthase-related protein [Candidatus Neomarinimicrobiota bacterium]